MAAADVSMGSGTVAALDAEAIKGLRERLRGQALVPGDDGYDASRKVNNAMINRTPAVIVRCTGSADVIEAVTFAREHGLLLSVKGGGHSVAGSALCEGGLTIDLTPMNNVRVDPNARSVRVGGGATWGAVDRETQVFGLATPSGYVSTTGVGGFTLGGGYGHLRRKYGMTCDSLLSADVVLADGRLITVSATENEDLYWALRGGGGNFGVVTSFEFACYPVGPMIFLNAVMYPAEDITAVLRGWRDYMDTAPEDISSNVIVWTLPDAEAFPPHVRGQAVAIVAALVPLVPGGSIEEAARVTQPLRELATPLLDMSGPAPYTAAQSAFDPLLPYGVFRSYWKAIDLTRLDDDVIDAIVAQATARPTPSTLVPIWHFGGAMSRVDPTATAFGRRSTPYMVSFDGSWLDAADDARCIAWVKAAVESMRAYSDGGQYVNFPGSGDESDIPARAAYGGNYERLSQIKAKYDPGNLFRVNVNIKPAV
jgi:FAD/FMN-containing dehydrogenase